MTNVVSLQASVHKYIGDKFSGMEKTSFGDHINAVLAAAGIPLDFNSQRGNREAFNAYLNLVDFKTLVVDSVNSLLIEKWTNTNETWRIWVNNYGLPDFKTLDVTAVGVVRQPKKIPPGGEYSATELQGEVASAKLDTYGDRIMLGRHTIINDDTSAIQVFAKSIAGAYDRQIGDKVYNFLKLNPVTFNSTELFHVDHSNIVAATNDFEADLSSAMDVMYAQVIDVSKTESEALRVQPKYVIVPTSKAFIAARIVGEYNLAVTDTQKLIVIVESRLSGFAGWFLACDNPYSSIALFTLGNRTTPEVFTNSTFTTDGLDIKHRFDYDIKPIDYRGLVKVN
jgi:hypothetical protein